MNLIAASENGGFMPEVLKQLLQLEEKREKLRSTLVAAAAYPAFLSVFSLGVVIFVLVVVFPQFGTIFANIKDELPITTKVLMWCSDLLREAWLPLLGVLAAATVLVPALGRAAMPAERCSTDSRCVRRSASSVFVKLYLVQSMRAMSLSLTNGVSAVDTLAACDQVVNNGLFRQFLARLRRDVEQGESLAVGFRKGGLHSADRAPADLDRRRERQLAESHGTGGGFLRARARETARACSPDSPNPSCCS